MEPLFAEICRRYGLGELECSPVPLTGGFMHKMYALSAARGRYALKLLNPHVMRRATAMANYRTAERLETLLEEHRLPILPALEFGGRKMQELDGRFFYLFDWYGGTALKGVEVAPEHCRKIGRVLARIHAVDRKEAPFEREKMHIDWESLAGALRRENEELYRLLQENRGILEQSERNGNQAAERMPPLLAVCHRDMDCKNVLWRGGEFRIIDLECLGYWHPFLELYRRRSAGPDMRSAAWSRSCFALSSLPTPKRAGSCRRTGSFSTMPTAAALSGWNTTCGGRWASTAARMSGKSASARSAPQSRTQRTITA